MKEKNKKNLKKPCHPHSYQYHTTAEQGKQGCLSFPNSIQVSTVSDHLVTVNR
jgi:hypothetical protein